jgi:glycosyltransferase involved in cell wall biosynthesis
MNNNKDKLLLSTNNMLSYQEDPSGLPTVSIITVTQYSRRECFINLVGLIKEQIYENIVEWVIVEGSKNLADAEENAEHIAQQTGFMHPVNIVYIPFSQEQQEQDPLHLSDLRNLGNNACRGDIIVCMDDDDYYPPTRVSHAVYKLMNSSALIAGCSKAYIYFYITDQLFQFKGFGKTHSTNNCMAYKREYLKNHSHEAGLAKAEEGSFTNYFSEPMVQLDPHKCIVMSGHYDNTVDKSWMCVGSPTATKNRMVNQLDTAVIADYFDIERMKKLFL